MERYEFDRRSAVEALRHDGRIPLTEHQSIIAERQAGYDQIIASLRAQIRKLSIENRALRKAEPTC